MSILRSDDLPDGLWPRGTQRGNHLCFPSGFVVFDVIDMANNIVCCSETYEVEDVTDAGEYLDRMREWTEMLREYNVI